MDKQLRHLKGKIKVATINYHLAKKMNLNIYYRLHAIKNVLTWTWHRTTANFGDSLKNVCTDLAQKSREGVAARAEMPTQHVRQFAAISPRLLNCFLYSFSSLLSKIHWRWRSHTVNFLVWKHAKSLVNYRCDSHEVWGSHQHVSVNISVHFLWYSWPDTTHGYIDHV